MDRKIKLIAVASVVAVMVSGCSGYRGGSNQRVNNNNGGLNNASGTTADSTGGGSSQVAGSGQVYGQRRSATCTPCAAARPKNTYTYTPAPKKQYTRPAPRPAPRQAGQHNQQYYVDRWNRQQQTQQTRSTTNTYNGYGSGNYKVNADAGNTTYYDYSSAGKAANNTATNVSASNKSIYTGSYQQKTYKPYQPTTYAGGSEATTNTNYTAGGNTTSSSGGSESTYTVKKGDTVFEIMRQTGVYWKDIIRINGLQAPAYNIKPGQIIRLK